MSSSSASIGASASAPADLGVDLARSGTLGPELRPLRLAARAANGHAVDGTKDGLAYLEIEHDAISEAMSDIIRQATAWCDRQEGNPDDVDTLLSRLVALIAQHASIEERYVYPLFRDHLKGVVEGITADMIYERNIMDDNINKEVLDVLMQMKMRKDGRLMLGTLKKLQVIEDEHLMQEEHWFALLRRQMSASQLLELANNLRSASVHAPTRPHSVVGPSHVPLSTVVHPVAGVVDRAFDKIVGRDTQLDKEHDGTKYVHGIEHDTKHV